jgi:hypothetical protein
MVRSMKERFTRTLAQRARIAPAIIALAFAGIYTAACDVHGLSEPGTLSTLSISPNPQTLAISGTQQFTAVGKDFSGAPMSVSPVWSVVAGGGTISATGMFTAGTATSTFVNTVQAVSGSLTSTATVIVINGPLASITVTPNPMSLPVGATQQYTAVGKDAAGNVVPLTPVWSVAASGGTISTDGLFTAGSSTGTFANTIKATSGSISGTATVTVTAALVSITVTPDPASMLTNSSQQFAATGRDVNGNIVAISPVWSVVNGGGSVNSNTGLFTSGGTVGTFSNTVKATSGTISGTATVTVSSTAPAPIVNLGAAAPNGIMAGTAFTCVIGGTINADIAISPGSTVTGFPPCVITGTQHLADATAAQAQIDLTTAYNTLAGLPCPAANNIGTTNIGGTTKAAGVYCSATSIGVTGALTLDGGGDPNATFVFQAGSGLTTAGNVVLINGAQAKNVYWQVGSSATIGTGSQWQGNILALTSITLVDNANLTGRALARNGAVSLGTNNTITLP